MMKGPADCLVQKGAAPRHLGQVEQKRGGAPPVPESNRGPKGHFGSRWGYPENKHERLNKPNSNHFMCEPEKNGAAR